MIPYYPQPVVHLGPFEIHAFGALAAIAVVVGGRTIIIRAQRMGIASEQMFRFCFWVYVSAMLGAVLSKTVLSDVPAFLADPSRSFRLSLGVRSAGGISAGFLAGVLWCRHHRLSLYESLRRWDIVAYSMPLAWMIGRLGCALAHDHRGNFTGSWIAVDFPEGLRYDLGLIEFLYLVGLAALFRFLDRRPRPVGFYIGLYGVTYGAFRFWLDTLHAQPLRFYGGALAVLIGLVCWVAMLKFERSHAANLEPAAVAASAR